MCRKEISSLAQAEVKGELTEGFFQILYFLFSTCRSIHDGTKDTDTILQQANRIRSGHDQNFRQLPLLQPQRLTFLPVCRVPGILLCTEAQSFQSKQVRTRRIRSAAFFCFCLFLAISKGNRVSMRNRSMTLATNFIRTLKPSSFLMNSL